MRKITYSEFSRFLLGEGYSPSESLNLFREMKQLSPKVRGWVIDWFFGGGYPTEVVEDMTVQMLVEEAELKPLNAFIAIDWLMKDPDAAKFALTHAKMPSVEEPEEPGQEVPKDARIPQDEEICDD